MRAFITPNRQQKILLTEIDIESLAPVGSALRMIDELVESLDTSAIEARYDLNSPQGQNPFHPKTLLKVALYALHNCRFSLRKMEEDTQYHLGYKWLTADRAIDHSTMGYFLARFHQEIVELFSQVVTICREKGLVEFDLLAVDSVKMRANASYKQTKDQEGLEKEEEKLTRRLGELLRGVKKGRQEEERVALEARRERVREARALLEERIRQKCEEKSAKEAEQIVATEKINVTDPDARIMEQGNGERNPAYSVTTTTDVGSDIITHYQVNEEDHDAGVLLEAVEGSQDQSGGTHEVVVADAGFASKENYEELEADGQEALIPDRRMEAERRGETVKGQWDRGKFIYDERRDNYICPGGEELTKLGEAMINGRKHFRYGNASACGECPFRHQCTKGSARVIFRDANEEVVERMRERLVKEENRAQYRLRAHAAESPYGNAKRNLKFSYVLRRGIEKVRMEMALLFMLHNGMKLRLCMSG